MCELLVGLGDVTVVGVDRTTERQLVVKVVPRLERPSCRGCGGSVWTHGYREVPLVDLPCFDSTVTLLVVKTRWRCPNRECPTVTFTSEPVGIGAARQVLTDRAARWATMQVGRWGRSVSEVAEQLGCDWHTVNNAVVDYGEALIDGDQTRIGVVRALSLDETLFKRTGRWHRQHWSTQLVDARTGQLLDVVEGRTAAAPAAWLAARPAEWLAKIR
jgi:transposase